ncbi:MAG: MaoC family dehydratase N-terminal domain-containing protein [Acidimicrobiia bacterium]
MAKKTFRVEAGHIMMFARSIGDPNPVYYDEEYAKSTEVGGIIAPPTFERASAQYDDDYSLRPKIGQPWFGSGKEPTGVPPKPLAPGEKKTNGLHAEQHYEYHRPLRPGDVLTFETLPGKKWEKVGRSGTLKFTENITEYRDQNGELVVTVRGVGVITEVQG